MTGSGYRAIRGDFQLGSTRKRKTQLYRPRCSKTKTRNKHLTLFL